MPEKVYLDIREYWRDSWRLARQVLDSGWTPEVMLALWRGGAVPGVAVHEFLKVKGVTVRHRPVVCASYTGIGTQADEIVFEGADDVWETLRPGQRVLVVDDVFDTGRTAEAVRARLAACACDAKVACVYWKPSNNKTTGIPDFYTRILEEWIVFPHEIDGLAAEEVAVKDPVLAALLTDFRTADGLDFRR